MKVGRLGEAVRDRTALAAWPLVGRDSERAVVAQAVASGTRAGIVLAGRAGVGKTRLAQESLHEAERRGCCATWVVATRAAETIPFGPFARLLGDVPCTTTGRLELVRRVGETLVARAQGRRLVMGVDDAHLLDDASAALVHQLAVGGGAFVVVTLRAGEHAPDPIVALWKDDLAERLELQALSEDEVAKLVPRVLGGQVDAPTMARLWGATRGNALFLRELLLAGLEGGALVQAGQVWSWKGPMAMSLRLQEIVDARLGTLEPDQVALMEVVAHGEPASASLLEELFAPATLEAAERRGVVVVEPDGRRTIVRLAHPLYGEAARARCPILRARAIHRELAAALEATGARRGEDILRLATFRLEAGEHGRPDLLLSAARRALAAFDLTLSERLARAAADAGGGVPATLAIAQSLVDQGRGAEAARLLGNAGDAGMTQDEVALASTLNAYGTWMGLGRAAEAEQILLGAETVLQDPHLRDDLSAMRATVLCLSGNPRRGIEIATELLDRPGASSRACVRVAPVAALGWAVTGRASLASAAARRWLEPSRRFGGELPFAPFVLRVAQSWASCLAGRLAEATAVAEELHGEAIARNATEAGAAGAGALGHAALARGRVSTAVHWLREGAAGLRGQRRINYLPCVLGALVQASVLAGDLVTAESVLAEAEAAMTPAVAIFEPQVGIARAWLAAGHGELSRARALLLEAAAGAEATGQDAAVVVALHDLARFGDPRVPSLERLACVVDGPFAPACAAHAAAMAAGNGPRLDEAAASFAAMGADLLAAEASAEAATAHGAEGRRAAMLASSARARRYLDACEGARTPVLSALATPALTPREREVAILASEGMTSAEIGRRLVLSPRTVESHLQRAYAKLGVTRRSGLRSVLVLPDPHDDPQSHR